MFKTTLFLSFIIPLLASNSILPNQLDAHSVELDYLRPGDHIYRYGAIYNGSKLSHHGIYTGNGVVHFTGGSESNIIGENGIINSLQTADIKLESFSQFMLNYDKCYRVNESNNLSQHQRIDIVNKATSYIGKGKDFFGGYSPSTNNCEHFANWCRTGQRISIQTEHISNNIGSGLGMLLSKNALDFIRSTSVILQNLFNIVGASPIAKSIVDASVLFTEKGIHSQHVEHIEASTQQHTRIYPIINEEPPCYTL